MKLFVEGFTPAPFVGNPSYQTGPPELLVQLESFRDLVNGDALCICTGVGERIAYQNPSGNPSTLFA